MSKDLHDIDDLFRSALEGYEEMPSAGTKKNLDAALDKIKAKNDKKRFLLWKRASLILVLLLASLALYESDLIKKGRDNHTTKKPVFENDKTNLGAPVDQEKISSADINTDSIATQPASRRDDMPVSQDQKNATTAPGISSFITENGKMSSKSKGSGNRLQKFQDNDLLFSITSPQANRKTNELMDQDTYLPISKLSIEEVALEKNIVDTTGYLIKKISLRTRFPVNNSIVKKNSGKKKFNSFWTIAAFASYDQAGYKLDSDEPAAITSIKFREASEPSFSTGLLMTRQLTPRFSLQSGIVYRNTAVGMKPQKTYAFVDPTGDVAYKYITSSGYAFFKPGFGPQPAVGDSLTTAEAKHTLENISVPLMVRHAMVNKRISITPGAGLEANFITKANLEVDIEDPFNREIVVVKRLSGTRSFYCSFIADAEIKYNLTKKVSVNIRPVFRYAISPLTKSSNIVENFPHSFGIGGGMTIKLR